MHILKPFAVEPFDCRPFRLPDTEFPSLSKGDGKTAALKLVQTDFTFIIRFQRFDGTYASDSVKHWSMHARDVQLVQLCKMSCQISWCDGTSPHSHSISMACIGFMQGCQSPCQVLVCARNPYHGALESQMA